MARANVARMVAEAELYARFARRVRLYGLRHLRDAAAADDLVQQVLLIVVRSVREGRVHELDRLDSFVLGTARTVTLDLKRGERRRDGLLERHGEELGGSMEPVFVHDLDRLRGCLEALPARERAVVVASFYDERTSAEIAADLSMSSGNVRVVRHRAMERLRECMS